MADTIRAALISRTDKGGVVSVQAMMAYTGNWGTAPLILTLGAIRR